MLHKTLMLAAAIAMPIVPRIANAQVALSKTYLVPMKNTPISRADLAAALLRGHIKEFGKLPSENRLSMGLAQVSLENGNGKYSYNHNL